MAGDDASDAEALFCLELYVHRVERLPKRLREAPPALALRFLDYVDLRLAEARLPEGFEEGEHGSRGGCARRLAGGWVG